MINVKRHALAIYFERGGMQCPYHGEHRFDPNDPPKEYGQATEIVLRLITGAGDLVFTERIPRGARPFFKVRRRKSGSDQPRTVGYKIGYQIKGYRKYRYVDLATGEAPYYSDKVTSHA